MHPLLVQHPLGDLRSPVCSHWVPAHPEGHDEPIPCVHSSQVQVGGHREHGIWVPDFGVAFQHAHDGFRHVPCTHLRQAHPQGNCDFGPCVHPLAPVARDDLRHVVYYTDDAIVRGTLEAAFDKLIELGVPAGKIATPARPLLVLHRAPASDGSPADPMWSHYDPVLHAIQLMVGHDVRTTLFHEIGHAIVGQRCVRALAPGQAQCVETPAFPGDALAEGWAEFVAGAIGCRRDSPSVQFGGIDLEGVPTGLGRPRKDVESYVARCLWDLFDTAKSTWVVNPANGRFVRRTPSEDETVSLPFAHLFAAWGPTLATISAGPFIADLDGYIDRLKANNPTLGRAIDAVVALNFPSAA